MARNIASRLERLENAIKPTRRQFFVFGDCHGENVEAEMQRLRGEHGPIRDDEFVVITWQSPVCSVFGIAEQAVRND
jgi:hypothetical protein